ncbi:hypothetical protein SteCoe_26630 [Stentor coeruleus]|uniref:B box-type domain-containing protein n=1 Tax=Stentor coeruleus TaxID=5963 RepID=A0A1R2BCE3_9CILI|nr:hypothetical protein SteCoe_26630 [Stentor coeruleus]
MDDHVLSYETISEENVNINPLKNCQDCQVPVSKTSGFFCKSCSGRICDTCSVGQKGEHGFLCQKCEKIIAKTHESVKMCLKNLKNSNNNLTVSTIKSLKERQDIINSLKERSDNHKIAQTLSENVDNLRQDFADSVEILMYKQREKRSISEKLNQKQYTLFAMDVKDQTVSFTLKTLLSELLCPSSAHNNKEALIQENQQLKQQIEEKLIENDKYYIETINSLKNLRSEIDKEHYQRPKPPTSVDSIKSLEEIQDFIKKTKQELNQTHEDIRHLAENYIKTALI